MPLSVDFLGKHAVLLISQWSLENVIALNMYWFSDSVSKYHIYTLIYIYNTIIINNTYIYIYTVHGHAQVTCPSMLKYAEKNATKWHSWMVEVQWQNPAIKPTLLKMQAHLINQIHLHGSLHFVTSGLEVLDHLSLPPNNSKELSSPSRASRHEHVEPLVWTGGSLLPFGVHNTSRITD